MNQSVVIAPWLMPLITGVCVALVAWLLQRQTSAKQEMDARFQALERDIAGHKLAVAKEYFSAEQAATLSAKLDEIVRELHSQNVVLTEVKTELRASRQAQVLAGSSHPGHPSS